MYVKGVSLFGLHAWLCCWQERMKSLYAGERQTYEAELRRLGLSFADAEMTFKVG